MPFSYLVGVGRVLFTADSKLGGFVGEQTVCNKTHLVVRVPVSENHF
jgi:hypothetical protein